jgi:predicted TIM-barrel fold metal-dependent hydrolase
MGWHLEFLANAESLRPAAGRLAALSVPYVIDRMGDFDVSAGTSSPDCNSSSGWSETAPGSSSPVLTGWPSPLCRHGPVRAVARRRRAGSVLYGSDWPHPGFWGLMPNDGDLLDLLADWVPDDLPRRSILTTNAQRLYGFTKE